MVGGDILKQVSAQHFKVLISESTQPGQLEYLNVISITKPSRLNRFDFWHQNCNAQTSSLKFFDEAGMEDQADRKSVTGCERNIDH